MKTKNSSGDYLALLTVKYDIHPDVLFCALLSAGEVGKAKCGPLSVEFRGKIDNKLFYLIREGAKVVAQFPVSEEFVERQRNPIRNFMERDMVQNFKPAESERKTIYCNIEELKIGKKVNIKANVVEVTQPVCVNTKFGNQTRLAKALLKDETGEIKLCLWKDQVDTVSAGDRIEIRNVTVTKFKGEKQLNLGKNSILRKVSWVEAGINPAFSEEAKTPN